MTAQAAPGAPVLFEREAELRSIERLVASARAGESRMLVIEGRAGLGKSRLLAALRDRAGEAGMRVLWARGSEIEREFPFGVVRQLVEPALADPAVRERWLAGSAAGAAPVLGMPGQEGLPDGDISFAALHGLYWLIANAAAEEPLLVAVDDLHWVDRASLRFMDYLSRRLGGMPILVATTLRPTDPGTDPGLIGELLRDPEVEVMSLAPLGEASAAELIQSRLGAAPQPAFLTACQQATGGNPLLLEQLLRSLGDDAVLPTAGNAQLVREIGPRAVGRTVLLRLARLPAAATSVAAAASVLGDGADLAAVAALGGVGEREAGDAVAALGRAEILRPEPPIGFVHALVRDAVYRDMTPARREEMHRRAAEQLHAAGAPAEKVAAHLLEVSRRGDPAVVEILRGAAAQAVGRGAPETAVTLLERALEEPPPAAERPRVLLELGLVQSQLDAPAGIARLEAAHATLADPQLRLRAVGALAWGYLFVGRPDEAAALAARTTAEAPTGAEDTLDWLTAIRLMAPFFGAEPTGPAARAELMRRRPMTDGLGSRCVTAIIAFDRMLRGASAVDVVPLGESALAGGVLYTRPDGYLFAVPALIAAEIGGAPAAEAHWAAALAAAHEGGSTFAISSAMLWHGFALMRRGDLTTALEVLQEAHELLSLWGIASNSYALGFMGIARVGAGDLRGAHVALDVPQLGSRTADGALHQLSGLLELALAEGRHDDALLLSDDMMARLAERGSLDTLNPAWWPWRALRARALDGLGRADEAERLLEEELALAEAWGTPAAVGQSLRVLGEIRRERGTADLERAVALLAASPARLEHARALFALGRRMRLDRRPAEAREPLREALVLAERCGAAPLTEAIRGELAATGARPRVAALSGPESLTPSERRVVGLAIEGRGNRDIAQELYVTLKTVELHLSSAYRKLGVRSRRDLPAAMAESGT